MKGVVAVWSEKKDECNVNLLNYVLSHARLAVKIRRNSAHYEKRLPDVWNILQRTLKETFDWFSSI